MKTKVFLFLITLSIYTHAQIMFYKNYGSLYDEHSYAMNKTNDMGYIMTGDIALSIGVYDLFLVKTDVNGTMMWSKTYGGSSLDEGRSVLQTFDGGYIIGGSTFSFPPGVTYLIRTDSNGNMLWSKTFSGTGVSNAFSIVQTSDSGFVVGAGVLMKLDPNGNLLWDKYFPGYLITKVEISQDQGFIMTSYGNLIKTDASGNIQWGKNYTGLATSSFIQTQGGGFLLAGEGGLGYNLVKTDSLGNVLWSKSYGNSSFNYYVPDIIETTNGDFIITGYTDDSNSSWERGFVVKTDSSGNILWGKYYNSNLFAGMETSDGGYVFGSYFFDIIKTDSLGNSGCYDTIASVSVQNNTSSASVLSISPLAGITSGNPVTMTGSSGTEYIMCSSVGINETNSEINSAVYPNPIVTEAVISILDPEFLPSSFRLYDVFGRMVFNLKLEKFNTKLERKNLPGGIYFYRIEKKNGIVATGKLVVK